MTWISISDEILNIARTTNRTKDISCLLSFFTGETAIIKLTIRKRATARDNEENKKKNIYITREQFN